MIWILMLKYWRWLLVASVLIVLVAAWRLDRNGQYRAGAAAATARITAELAIAAEKQRDTARAASVEYQTAKAARGQEERVRYVEVQKIVDRPVYRNVCLDDDGMRIINNAIAGGD